MGRIGIPTKANGYQMRSRLEASWAHFFDLIGWAWEYEPFDTDGYIPDFLIVGDRPLLVEIKPAASFADLEPARIKARAALPGHWTGDILYLGASPFINRRCSDCHDCWGHGIGLLDEWSDWFGPTGQGEDGGGWSGGCAVFGSCWICGNPAIGHCIQGYAPRPCRCENTGNPPNWELHDYDTFTALWAEAKNRTQWNPPR